jgi:hypothetical protein
MNCTREAGNRDEGEGGVVNTLESQGNGAVGFIDWLDGRVMTLRKVEMIQAITTSA